MAPIWKFILLTVLVGFISVPCFKAADKDNEWIIDKAIPSLLRFDMNGQLVSSDLGDHITFTCTGKGSSRTCSVDNINSDPSDENNSIQPYATGVVLYAAIAVIAGILVILLTIIYLCYSSWCCALRTCSGLCIKPKKNKKSHFSKPVRRFGGAALILAFFSFLVVMILLAYTLGIQVAFEAMTDVVDAPLGIAQITYQLSLAMQPLFIGTVSTVMLPTFRNLNSTLLSAINMENIVQDLKVVDEAIDLLPDINDLKETLDSIGNSTDSLNDDLQQISDYSDTYSTNQDAVQDASDILLSELNNLDQNLSALSSALDPTNISVLAINGFMIDFFGADGPDSYSTSDQDGYIDSVQYDINHMTRDDTAGDGIPTSATLNDAATGVAASIARLLNQDLDGNVAETTLLISKLENIYDSVVKMQDFAATADNIVLVNAAIADMIDNADGSVTLLPDQLTALQNALDAMGATDTIKTHVQHLFDALDTLNAESLSSLLDSAETSVDSISSDISNTIDQIETLSSVLDLFRPPIRDLLVAQPASFNRTIMKPPFDSDDIYETVIKTLNDTQDSIDEILPEMRDVLDSIQNDIDFSALSSVDQQDVSLDFLQSDLEDALDAAEISTGFSASSYSASLLALNTSLHASRASLGVIDGFRALQRLRYTLEVQLRDAVGQNGDVGSDGSVYSGTGEYRLLVQGMCGSQLDTYCTTAAQCSSGTCDHISEYRCAADGSVFVPCTDDSECSNGHCLADTTRATFLQGNLTALAQPAVTDFGQDSLSSAYDDLRSDSSDFDSAQLQTDLTDINDLIVAADMDDYIQGIVDMQTELAAKSYASYMSGIDTAQSSIDVLAFGDLDDSLGSAQEQIDDYSDDLTDYILLSEEFKNYFYQSTGLRSRFSELEKDELETTLENEGFGPVLMSVGQTIESSSDDIIEILKNSSYSQDRIEITKSLREPARYLDRFTANPHRGFVDVYAVGSLYYMMQLTNETADMMVDARDPTQNTITTNTDGDRYPDNKICVTRKCFSGQQDEFESGYGMYLPLLLVPLAIVALLALCNFACMFVPSATGGFCRRKAPGCMICMIIALVPWYLIFSGFLFAFFIGLSDTCTSGPHIAANYISAYGDPLCDRLGGNGTLTECDFSGNEFNVTVNIKRMTDIVLGMETCSGGDNEDPFYIPINALAEQMRGSANKRTKDEVRKDRYKKYRQPLKNIVLDFSDGSSLVVRDFLNNVGSDVITCDNMQDVIEYVKAPICYSVVGPWSWMLATIYLAAWSMCCLGIPAGCALKNSFKWDSLEDKHRKEEAAAASRKASVSKNNMLKFHLLALRRRGPMVGRTTAFPPNPETMALLGGDEEEGGENRHHRGGGGGGGAGGGWGGVAAAVSYPGGRAGDYELVSGEEGGGGRNPVYAEAIPAPPSGGYIAHYPKAATSSYKESELAKKESAEQVRDEDEEEEEEQKSDDGSIASGADHD